MKFAEEEEAACLDHVASELVSRGVPSNLLRGACDALLKGSQAAEDTAPEREDPNAMEFIRRRRCWVIRTEDLDLVGTLFKYAGPLAGGAGALAAATALVSAPVAGAAGAALAMAVGLGLNWRRKGVELDPLAIRTLALLKERGDGVSTSDLPGMLEAAIGQPFDAKDVAGILDSLKNAKVASSGTAVAVAVERNGRWFSTA